MSKEEPEESGVGWRFEPAKEARVRRSVIRRSVFASDELGGRLRLRLRLRGSWRQPIGACFRSGAREGRRFGMTIRTGAGDGEFEKGADLFLRGAQSFENPFGEPDRSEEKCELNEEATELVPIVLHPIAEVAHGRTSS